MQAIGRANRSIFISNDTPAYVICSKLEKDIAFNEKEEVNSIMNV